MFQRGLLKQLQPWLPGIVSALIITGLWRLGVWQGLDLLAYRSLFYWRGQQSWAEPVVVVAIDDKSLAALGSFPLPRLYYQDFIETLQSVSPGVIVLNVLFVESQLGDVELAYSMLRHGGVVLPQGWTPEGKPLLPPEPLREAAVGLGHIRKLQDADGITRQVELQVSNIPSLGLAALEAYSLFSDQAITLPTQQSLGLNWPGSVDQIPTYSLIDVIQGQVSPTQFTDKIILVGVTATGLDPLQTPFDQLPAASGLHLHAATIHTLLHHNALSRLPWLGIGAIMLLVGPGFSGMLWYRSPLQRLVAVGTVALSWAVISLIGLHLNVWLPTVEPIATLLLTGGLVALLERLKADAELADQIQQLWKTHAHNMVYDPSNFETPIASMPSRPSKIEQIRLLAEAFGRSQSAQAAIARSLSLGLVAAELKGQVWFCNPVARQLLNLTIGSDLTQALVPQWIIAEDWQKQLDQLQQQGYEMAWESRQHTHWFMLRLEPIFDHETSDHETLNHKTLAVAGLLLVIEDITRSRQLQTQLLAAQIYQQKQLIEQNQALDEARRLAEAAAQMKSAFLANMSHEIRTPMTAVVGLTDLLAESSLNREQQDWVDVIQSSSDHLLTLINEILDFSKLEAHAVELEVIDFDLVNCIDRVIELFGPQAQRKQLEVISWIATDVPRHLQGDPTRLSQILVNLIGNAIKFTHQGGITLKVEALEYTDQDVTLRFSVDDTGIGISAAGQEKLFQSFSQVDASTTRQFGGTGLGLAIAKGLVELMSGEIGVSSFEGIGSRFWFRVIMSHKPLVPDPLPSELEARSILIVEDHDVGLQALVEQTKSWGMRVESSPQPDQALAMIKNRNSPYDILLLDLQCPHCEMLLQWVKVQPRLSQVKSLGMTLPLSPHQNQIYRDLGLTESLLKPITSARLYKALQGLLGSQAVSRVPSQSISRSPRILLAEDNPVNQKVASLQLQSLGCQVDVAANGFEVLKHLHQSTYELILMDCQMPEMDGYTTTEQIRSEQPEAPIVIVAMTANTLPEERSRCLAVGMNDFLSKPVRKNDLWATLQRWIPDLQIETPESTVQASETPLFNPDMLMQLCGRNERAVLEFFVLFLTEGQECIQAIQQAIAAQDWKGLSSQAHRLRGSSMNIKATPLLEAATQMERVAREEAVDQIMICQVELEQQWQLLATCLRDHYSLESS